MRRWIIKMDPCPGPRQHGNRIKLGTYIFVYLEYDEDPDMLNAIVRDEQDLRRKVATARFDTFARTDREIELQDAVRALIETFEDLSSIKDAVLLQNRTIDKAFQLIRKIAGINEGEQVFGGP
jgi:hypothetical protein